MKLIALHCKKCKKYSQIKAKKGTLICPECKEPCGKIEEDDVFNKCPICTCRQFYLSKNFNQFLGCFIMAVGIVLVPWTYGLSLPVFALIDWLLVRKVKNIINCYRCGCEFHGFETDEVRFKPFLHHIGLKYDKYR